MVGTASHEPAHPERGAERGRTRTKVEFERNLWGSRLFDAGTKNLRSLPSSSLGAWVWEATASEKGFLRLRLGTSGNFLDRFVEALPEKGRNAIGTSRIPRAVLAPRFLVGLSQPRVGTSTSISPRYRSRRGGPGNPGRFGNIALPNAKTITRDRKAKGRGRQDTTIESESITQSTD